MNTLLVRRELTTDECQEIRDRIERTFRGRDWWPMTIIPTSMVVEVWSYPMREAAG